MIEKKNQEKIEEYIVSLGENHVANKLLWFLTRSGTVDGKVSDFRPSKIVLYAKQKRERKRNP